MSQKTGRQCRRIGEIFPFDVLIKSHGYQMEANIMVEIVIPIPISVIKEKNSLTIAKNQNKLVSDE